MTQELSTPHLALHTVNLSQELTFLIACCQTDPSENDTEFIHSYLNNPHLDTNALVGLAHQHGILPLVYKSIKHLLESNDPNAQYSMINAEILTELKAHYMNIAQRNMFMSAELIRIMKLLEENDIEALAFKGPTLSQMAYGDITLRQYGDLDILIKKEDIFKIDALLKQEGYERLLLLTPVQEKVWFKYAHDLGLVHSDKRVHLEMHWSFLDEDYPIQVNLDTYWENIQKLRISGQEIATFSPENLLVYLCIHGSKHLWERLEWIKDIDLLIRNGEVDWDEVLYQIEGSGFEKMVFLGLSLSTSLLHTPLPASVTEKISIYLVILTLSDFVTQHWQTPKSTFAKTAVMLKLFPGLKARLLYLHKIILKPSFNEYWFIDLPRGLYWAYYLLRPYLLVKKYFTKQKIA